jgi:nucleotide-binding universal stress UspA family protein
MKEHITSYSGLKETRRPQNETIQPPPVTRKVTLVVEYGYHAPFETSVLKNLATVLKRLDCFLSPSSVALTLVHAEVDWLSAEESLTDGAGFSAGETLPQLETGLKQANKQVRQELSESGFQIVQETECGYRDKSLKRFTETLWESEQDLLVIASASDKMERSRISHFASQLATHSPVSVLILRSPVSTLQPLAPKIIFGVDGSEASMNAARKLGQILDSRDCQLELAIVQSPVYQENAVLAPYVNQAVLDEALEVNAKMVFEMVTDILDTQGIQVSKCQKLSGSPATELGNLAALAHPDLLVVGSHNRKGVLAWLMGSVSSQLLQWDTHNLLIVR